MRIIAGTWRGRRLAAVGKGDAGAHLRPTTDRVRESLFNILGGGRFGDPCDGAVVLDMFAGTGALGLEALSRGAASCTFVENGRVAQGILRENIKLLDCTDQTKLITRDATKLGTVNKVADLIFLDPPYGKNMGQKALNAAQEGGWIAPQALVIWEENAEQSAPDGFTFIDSRKFGDSYMTFLRAD